MVMLYTPNRLSSSDPSGLLVSLILWRNHITRMMRDPEVFMLLDFFFRILVEVRLNGSCYILFQMNHSFLKVVHAYTNYTINLLLVQLY